MTRRELARLAGTAALSSRLSLSAAPASPERPNVIIVLADDQGYGDISAHGHPEIRTPNLDKLHSQSVRFTDFHSSPMCTPTRAQLMTGRDSLFTRAMNVSSGRTPLRTDLPTMPEIFRRAGYRTGLFGKWHLGDTYPYRPQDRGFQESVWYPSSHIGSVSDAWDNDYFNDNYRHNGHLQHYSGYSGDVFFNEAMRWMESAASSRAPFFCYVPLNVAHGPLFVPPEFVEPYKHLPKNAAKYSAMVANIDHNMGRLEAMLNRTGLHDNTVVIYMSDNGGTAGTMRFNAGRKGNKTQLWEGGHRVPCFIRWPAGKVGGGRDVNDLAQMQDILPTLMDLCTLTKPAPSVKFDGVSLAPVLRGQAKSVPDRIAVVQFSRMPIEGARQRPQKYDSAVMWKTWRLLNGKQLYNIATDPTQDKDIAADHPDIATRLRQHYDAWWPRAEPLLDSFLPVVVGSEKENPVMATACEWADVFVDQGAQVRAGIRRNGPWHINVAHAGEYEIALRRWPRDCDAAISAGIPAHVGEDGQYAAGVALPIAQARLKVGAFDKTIPVAATDREAVFRMRLPAGKTQMQSWFLDGAGADIVGAYFAYVERTSPLPNTQATRILFDTDIMGDVDDVGAVAALHALANRGEAQIIGMGVSSKHAASPLCLSALNQHFGRPTIPIGVNKGDGFLRDSKYAEQIAAKWPHALKSADQAPDAVALYRKLLAAQPDDSVVLVSVGQLTNLANLLKAAPTLVKRKIRLWVCMGAQFPEGREANIYHHVPPAQYAVDNWPGRVIFSGWEIGQNILTGGRVASLPETSPVRRAYELFNGAQPHKSWDQTAVLYGVRCSADQDRGYWTLSSPGRCIIDDKGRNTWRDDPAGRHQYLIARMAPAQIAATIENLMLSHAG